MRKMKDSRVAWIGEIPANWEVVPLFRVLREHKEKNIDNKETNVLSLSYGSIVRRNVENNMGLLPESFATYNIIHPDYIVLRLTDLQNDKRSLRTGLVKEQGIITSAYVTIKPAVEVDSRYYHYLLHSYDVMKIIYNLGNGVRQNLKYEELSKLPILLPDVYMQRLISDYLDCKCAKIDDTIVTQQKSVEQLREYKQAVIIRTVTRGLNLDVPIKDSGVEWIGDIPANWVISKVKAEFDNLDGQRKPISSESRSTGIYDYYGASGVIDQIGEYIFDETLLLVGEDGANLALRNLPLVYIATGKYWVNNHAHILKPKQNISLKYMAYQLECIDLHNYLSGSTQPKLTQNSLSNIPVVVPPPSEQQQIATYLDNKCTKIDTAIIQKETLIQKLQEYKKSLIYECVTGKREV